MKASSSPRFSIVIPAYNEADYISETLKSLKALKSQESTEIIVVDNNCTDNTAEIARSYDARVVYEKNPGVCWARQAGTAAAKGDIVISTDADTTFPIDWISQISDAFDSNGVVAVAGPCRYVNGPAWGGHYTKLLFGLVNVVYRIFGKTTYITATNTAFKRDAWSGYNTGLTQGGDELDLLRNLKKNGKVKFINNNCVSTSSRRLTRGFIYSFFFSFLLYYLVEYNLNRVFNRSFFGMAPKFRNDQTSKWYFPSGVIFVIVIAAFFLVGRQVVHEGLNDVATILQKYLQRFTSIV